MVFKFFPTLNFFSDYSDVLMYTNIQNIELIVCCLY